VSTVSTVILLVSAAALAGLWSGLLLTVTKLLHPMFTGRDARGFAEDLGRFLPIARRSPTNYVLVLGMVITAVAALVAVWDRPGDAVFVLVATGLVLVVIGAVLVSRYLAEPNYDVILGWDPAAPPTDWRVAQRRYVCLNWIRGAFVWSAFGCFLAAICVEVA